MEEIPYTIEDFHCPYCNAKPGWRCRDDKGNIRRNPHTARIHEFYEMCEVIKEPIENDPTGLV